MPFALFIDGSYIYKTYPNKKINYLKLREFLEEDLDDVMDEGYFFNAHDDPPKATSFNKALTYPPPQGPGLRLKIYWLNKKLLYWPAKLGGEPVIHPELKVQYELVQQKAVDVGLVFHLIRSFSKRHWTKLVLCAGDGDFHEPVQILVENENVDLYLVGTMDSISPELRPWARKIYEIDKEPLLSLLENRGSMTEHYR